MVYKICRFSEDGVGGIDQHKIRLEDIYLIGKTVFLERQEAEVALKKYNLIVK